MCGIIGVIGSANSNVSPLLMAGLKRLEYRGYDSAGIATLADDGALLCRRSEGKLSSLEMEMRKDPIAGTIGIGHTRWATHGRPTTHNAHPHRTDKVAVVHNGIIENFRELRERLQAAGCELKSDTDTEVIPHLITQYLEQGLPPEEAVSATLAHLSGTFALAILFAGKHQFLMAAKRGSPLVIGHGDHGYMYVGSDAAALVPLTSRISYLEDGDIARVTETEVSIWDERAQQITRPICHSTDSEESLGKKGCRHYMLKEIYEQPMILAATLDHYVDRLSKTIVLPKFPFDLDSVSHITVVGCGTSYYAGMIGKYWLEKIAGISVTLDIASEFRYREAPSKEKGIILFISQSGETADTLAALFLAKSQRQHILSIVNVVQSSMARASDAVLPTFAGPEIGVASTKAFTAQLLVLACLTLALAKSKKTLKNNEFTDLLEVLVQLPALVMSILEQEQIIQNLAHEILGAQDVLFLGRGTSYPVAMEGALKFKELTYVHAEGIAAGELKHGPLALVDERAVVVAVIPSDRLFEKTCSNLQEVAVRGGKIMAFCDAKGAVELKGIAARTLVLPTCHSLLTPIVYAIPLQLLAYHAALSKGHDVDQPRNLAKSVTVE